MSDPNAVSEEEFGVWERELAERAVVDKERNAWQSAGPKGSEHLIDRIVELENKLYVKEVALGSMAELLEAKLLELRVSERRRMRAEDAFQGVLDEMQPKTKLRAA